MYFLKRIREKFKRRPSYSEYLNLDGTVIPKGIVLTLRKPLKGKKYLKVESGSLIEGQFIFERETGEVTIGKNSFVGGSTLICINRIEIGNDVLISWGCTIIDNDAHSLNWSIRKNDVADWEKGVKEGVIGKYKNWQDVTSSPIRIHDKVWIGFNSIILKGVTLGEGSIVGAGSVVTKDVAPYTIVAGNPARPIRKIENK